MSVLLVSVLSLSFLCAHGQQVGDLRLVDNSGSNTGIQSGRLEVYTNPFGSGPRWYSVCSDLFDTIDAEVACRQLGFTASLVYGTVESLGFVEGRDRNMVMGSLRCSGAENRLADCSFSDSVFCRNEEEIALFCYNRPAFVPPPSPPSNGDVQLFGSNGVTGIGVMAGTVEVYTDNWSTVQNLNAGSEEADVICRQLGFTSAFIYGGFILIFPSSFSALSTVRLDCSGSESSWTECSTGRGSGALELGCSGTYSPAVPVVESIRLNTEGTSRPYSGRLEIYYNGEWGTVCSEGFGQNEADIACRQLGLEGGLYYGNVEEIGFGQGSGSIWLTRVSCFGSEYRLSQCSHSGYGNTPQCDHNEDIGLVCTGAGSLRLTDVSTGTTSPTLSSGRLEVYFHGTQGSFFTQQWGTVCSVDFGQAEADVACRGLGYARASSFSDIGTTTTNLPILLGDIDCSGSETSLLLCDLPALARIQFVCDHTQDIQLSCSSLSTGGVVAMGILIPAAVIALCCILICCGCRYYTKRKNASRTTAATSTSHTSQPRSRYAFSLDPVSQQSPHRVDNDYSITQAESRVEPPNPSAPQQPPTASLAPYPSHDQPVGPPYPTAQNASPYPTVYPSGPQQPPAGYPTGQAPPAPYPSGPHAPPAPHPSTQAQSGGEKKKHELYPDAPPAYGELMNYPSAPRPAQQQQQPPPDYQR